MLDFLWRASWQGSTLVLAVWLVSRCLPGIPARSRSWVWWLASIKFSAVALILIMPLNVAILPTPDYSGGQRKAPRREMLTLPSIPAPNNQSDPSLPRPFNPSVFLVGAWVAGVGICALRLAGGYARLRRILQAAAPLQTEEAVGVRLLESGDVSSPMVVGPFRAAILVPTGWLGSLTKEERDMALRHEMAHVHANDLAWGLLPEIATTVFFFLPTAWLARREWIAAREEACDAEVIAACGVSPRRYGELLLKVAARNVRSASIPAMGAVSRNSQLKQRIRMLKNINHTSTSRVVAPIVGAALLVLLPWQVVARGDQAAGGTIAERKAQTQVHIKNAGLGVLMYCADYDGYYPSGKSTDAVFQQLSPYVKGPNAVLAVGTDPKIAAYSKQMQPYKKRSEVFMSLNPAGAELKFNTALSGANEVSVQEKGGVLVIFDPNAWPDGTHVGGDADGRSRIYAADKWDAMKSSLSRTYRKAPLPPRKHA